MDFPILSSLILLPLLGAIFKGRFDIVADHNIQDYIDALETDLKQ